MGFPGMVHGSLKQANQVERRGLTVVKPRQTISAIIRFSEDQLESVLNLPVADVAGGIGQPEARIA